METKINVCLYQSTSPFTDKDTPIDAETVYCDNANNCSLYKDGKCLRVRMFNSPRCKYGQTSTVTGYITTSEKHEKFKSKYTSDKCFNNLSNIGNTTFAVIGDWLFFNFIYVGAFFDVSENLIIMPAVDSSEYYTFIEKKKCTAETLLKIFNYVPHDCFDNVLETYRSAVVPDIMSGIKRLLPDLYDDIVRLEPSLTI